MATSPSITFAFGPTGRVVVAVEGCHDLTVDDVIRGATLDATRVWMYPLSRCEPDPGRVSIALQHALGVEEPAVELDGDRLVLRTAATELDLRRDAGS